MEKIEDFKHIDSRKIFERTEEIGAQYKDIEEYARIGVEIARLTEEVADADHDIKILQQKEKLMETSKEKNKVLNEIIELQAKTINAQNARWNLVEKRDTLYTRSLEIEQQRMDYFDNEVYLMERRFEAPKNPSLN